MQVRVASILVHHLDIAHWGSNLVYNADLLHVLRRNFTQVKRTCGCKTVGRHVDELARVANILVQHLDLAHCGSNLVCNAGLLHVLRRNFNQVKRTRGCKTVGRHVFELVAHGCWLCNMSSITTWHIAAQTWRIKGVILVCLFALGPR